MNKHRLRSVLLKLDARLTEDDRQRFHFFMGNNVPRRIRDDKSLNGTLSLLESLFDRDIINERDFTFLIDAFEEIECFDAAKLLRGFFFSFPYICFKNFLKNIEQYCSQWVRNTQYKA